MKAIKQGLLGFAREAGGADFHGGSSLGIVDCMLRSANIPSVWPTLQCWLATNYITGPT